MSALIVFGLAYAAMALLALAMERHQEQFVGRALAPQQVRLLRAGGWLLLALALWPALAAWGTQVGIAGWLGVLSFAALAIGLQLSYAPRSGAWSVPAALVLACAMAYVALLMS